MKRSFALTLGMLLWMMASTGTMAHHPAKANGTVPGSQYKSPRGYGGHPDLSGIWQVMNTADWDLEEHAARAALAMRPGPSGTGAPDDAPAKPQ